MNQTIDTLRETLAIQETMARIARPIDIHSQTDDGEWIVRSFANEPAAAEFERKMQRVGVLTRRSVA